MPDQAIPAHSATGPMEGVTRTQLGEDSHGEMRLERMIVVYLVGGVLVLTTTIAKRLLGINHLAADIPAGIGAIVLGLPLFLSAVRELAKGRWTSATLASLAIIAAIAIGRYEIAGFLAFILLIADQVVRRTAWGAQRAISQLVELTPDTARLLTKDGDEREVGLEQVQVGMVVRVYPGENLPVDGVVVRGQSSINQASLTGEAVPAEVQEGSDVYAGTTNLTGTVEVRVTGVGAQTTIGKVTELIREAESTRSPNQLIIERVAQAFVPVAIAIAGLVWFLMARSMDPYTRERAAETAITVLVVVCPSALLLASPTAMVAAFAAAARLGILIKQTNYLEAAATVDTVVLDKTGTVTTGRFAVSRLAPAEGVEGASLLQSAADAEQQSNHPLAKSIIDTAKRARIAPAGVDRYEEVHGRGVRAWVDGEEILAGRGAWLIEVNPDARDAIAKVEEKIEGMSGVHVMRAGRYLGAVGLEDRVRSNAKDVVTRLRDLGVKTVAIFTGDRFGVAKRVGQSVGVDRVEAECLPEEKHDLIGAMSAQGRRVLMVGDGINDGPSLARADVGVAMGLSGSDIATNSAGVALMNDDLSRIPFLIELARRTRAIIMQNIVASFIIALIGLVLAATGFVAIGVAVLYHFVGDLFVIGNSFRLVRFGEAYAEETGETLLGEDEKKPGRKYALGTATAVSRPAPSA
ncbi:MAG: cation-translocating P-type ATPase [Phycisphaeraceae bacterium]|nr:cation-translocating P-type ATPase [Phycisphaeraceae bacterium]